MKGQLDVCAWCRHTYGADGMPVRKLTPEEYVRVDSHGVCKPCREAVVAQQALWTEGRHVV